MERIRIKPAGWLVLIFAISVPTLWVLERSFGAKPRVLRVGIEVWPGYAAGIYANNGFDATTKSLFYRDCNLEVQFGILSDADTSRDEAFTPLTPDGKPNPRSFDVMWSTIDFAAYELPRLRAKHPSIDARVFLQLDWSRGGDAIVVDKSIQNIAQLEGKTVSLAWNGPSGWLLASALYMDRRPTRDFVKLDDTQDPKKALKKFIERKVDAAVLWEPYVTAAQERQNSHVLLSTRSAANLIADLLVARKDFIDRNKDVLTDFCRCWLKAVEDVMEVPGIAVKPLMAGYNAGLRAVHTESDSPFRNPETTKQMLTQVALAGEAENAELFGLSRNHKQDEHSLFYIIFKKARELMGANQSFQPGDATDLSILDSLLSPKPQPVTCQGTENRQRVISREFLLPAASPTPEKDPLHDLADAAQTFSHACIALAGPHAAANRSRLIQDFNLNETRFLVSTDRSADRGTVYVLPDTGQEKNALQTHSGDDLQSWRAQR